MVCDCTLLINSRASAGALAPLSMLSGRKAIIELEFVGFDLRVGLEDITSQPGHCLQRSLV